MSDPRRWIVSHEGEYVNLAFVCEIEVDRDNPESINAHFNYAMTARDGALERIATYDSNADAKTALAELMNRIVRSHQGFLAPLPRDFRKWWKEECEDE